MTRYLCGHPSHRRHGEIVSVDVTAQVRAERAWLPRPSAYLAITEDVLAAIAELPGGPRRAAAIEGVVSGAAEHQDLPVVLMSRHSVSREPGLYELDDLRGREPAIERLMARVGASGVVANAPGDLLVIVDDAQVPEQGGSEGVRTAVLTRAVERTRSIPQGAFRLSELASSLAIADPTEESMIDAVRSTPLYDPADPETADPWRVVIECPNIEGLSRSPHQISFTGTGAPEATIAYGTPVDGWDAAMESSMLIDMAPAEEVSRVEHRLWTLVAVEALMFASLIGFSWASGGLQLAARETPAWLGLGLLLAVGAVSFGAIPLFAVHDPAANLNDTFELAQQYESRTIMLRSAAAISAVLFGIALMAGVIPPLSEGGRLTPAASVRFNTSGRPVTATMHVTATNVGAGRTLNVTMREYTSGDRVGTLVGNVTRDGSPSGTVALVETFAVDPGARYVSVYVSTAGETPSVCSPAATATPGCTVLAVPPPTPSLPQTVTNIVVSPAVVPSAAPISSPSP